MNIYNVKGAQKTFFFLLLLLGLFSLSERLDGSFEEESNLENLTAYARVKDQMHFVLFALLYYYICTCVCLCVGVSAGVRMRMCVCVCV